MRHRSRFLCERSVFTRPTSVRPVCEHDVRARARVRPRRDETTAIKRHRLAKVFGTRGIDARKLTEVLAFEERLRRSSIVVRLRKPGSCRFG